jgi:hypothetical protein
LPCRRHAFTDRASNSGPVRSAHTDCASCIGASWAWMSRGETYAQILCEVLRNCAICYQMITLRVLIKSFLAARCVAVQMQDSSMYTPMKRLIGSPMVAGRVRFLVTVDFCRRYLHVHAVSRVSLRKDHVSRGDISAAVITAPQWSTLFYIHVRRP